MKGRSNIIKREDAADVTAAFFGDATYGELFMRLCSHAWSYDGDLVLRSSGDIIGISGRATAYHFYVSRGTHGFYIKFGHHSGKRAFRVSDLGLYLKSFEEAAEAIEKSGGTGYRNRDKDLTDDDIGNMMNICDTMLARCRPVFRAHGDRTVDTFIYNYRIVNALKAAGISTFRDMVDRSAYDLIKIKNLGIKSIEEIGRRCAVLIEDERKYRESLPLDMMVDYDDLEDEDDGLSFMMDEEESSMKKTSAEYQAPSAPSGYSARPYEGFSSMEAFESLGCDMALLEDISSGRVDRKRTGRLARFRIDCVEGSSPSLTPEEMNICILAERFLLRGARTLNSAEAEAFADDMCATGARSYSDEDADAAALTALMKPPFVYGDGEERAFAEEVLPEVLGERWMMYTDTSVDLDSVCSVKGCGRAPILIGKDGRDFIIELSSDGGCSAAAEGGYEVISIDRKAPADERKKIGARLADLLGPGEAEASSLMGRKIFIHRLIHQIEIALVTSLMKGVIDREDSLSFHMSSFYMDEEESFRIFAFAVEDLRRLTDIYCRLYGTESFLRIDASEEAEKTVCAGTLSGREDAVLITGLSITREIENIIPDMRPEENILSPSMEVFDELTYRAFRRRTADGAAAEALMRITEGLDTVVTMNEAEGRSLIYETVALAVPQKIVVICPELIGIRDRADDLRRRGMDAAAVTVNRREDLRNLEKGGPAIIFMLPRILRIKKFRESLGKMDTGAGIYAVIVDGASSISEYSSDFRASCIDICSLSRKVLGGGGMPVTAAFSDCCSSDVKADIGRDMDGGDDIFVSSPSSFRSGIRCSLGEDDIVSILEEKVPAFFGTGMTRFYADPERRGIIFCSSEKAPVLLEAIRKGTGIGADICAEGMGEREREKVLARFRRDGFSVLVATRDTAWGIYDPHVVFTISWGMPSSMEEVLRTAGRSSSLMIAAGTSEAAGIPDDERNDELKHVYRMADRMIPRDGSRPVQATVKGEEDPDTVMRAAKRLMTAGVVADYTVKYPSMDVTLIPDRDMDICASEDFTCRDVVKHRAHLLIEKTWNTLAEARKKRRATVEEAVRRAFSGDRPDIAFEGSVLSYFDGDYSERISMVTEGREDMKVALSFIIEGCTGPEDLMEVIGGHMDDHPVMPAARALVSMTSQHRDREDEKDDILRSLRALRDMDGGTDCAVYILAMTAERDADLFEEVLRGFTRDDVMETCSRIMDCGDISEEYKGRPAGIFFRLLTEDILTAVGKMKGE